MLCLVVLTTNAIPAPQGPLARIVETALENGVARAAERVFEREEGFGGSRGFGQGGYGQNGNYGGNYGGNYNNNYRNGGGFGSGSVFPGQNYYG